MDYDLDDWKIILATCALILCMVWDIAVDVAKHYFKVSLLIPTNLFVLSSLTVQILGYVEIEKVSVSGSSTEKDLEWLVNNQLRLDAARLTACVFVGCILPGMAMAGTQGGWSNIAALFLILSFHTATEIYALQNVKTSKVEAEAGQWFVSSGVILLLGVSSLLLLLGTVMLSGKYQRQYISRDISEIESDEFGEWEEEEDRWEKFRSEVMKLWVSARRWKTGYFLWSSLYSPGVGMIVTICVVVMMGKVACGSFLHNNGGGNLIFYLQCIFILLGWILMLFRWFKAALFFASSIDKMLFIRINRIFLVPAAVVVKPLCPRLAYFIINPEFRFVQNLFKFDKKSVLQNSDWSKYRSREDIWFVDEDLRRVFVLANRNSYHRLKVIMDESGKVEKSCRGLLSIMGNGRVFEEQSLRPLRIWMKTISDIFSDIADMEIGVDMKDAFAAYKETQVVLNFVDCPNNIVMDFFNIFGTLDFERFEESIDCEGKMWELEGKLKQSWRLEHTRIRSMENPFTAEERERIDNKLRGFSGYFRTQSNSVLVRLGECSYNKVEELSEMLSTLVGHVIVSCLLEAPESILKYEKQWTQNFHEGKIEKSIELAGMVSALLEKLVENGDIHSEDASEGDDLEAANGPGA
ncbi:uncharacterized protein LOC131856063 [Cryptomeria japonica]|uniref:uncharacterized protein LOC131856063 n=1 Tax=Cryptomeria japonica TaxID=3369 RepID=UPI0027DA1478|nr:uncharacterized protein LOC131856063 [Cryptomeria japonica]